MLEEEEVVVVVVDLLVVEPAVPVAPPCPPMAPVVGAPPVPVAVGGGTTAGCHDDRGDEGDRGREGDAHSARYREETGDLNALPRRGAEGSLTPPHGAPRLVEYTRWTHRAL